MVWYQPNAHKENVSQILHFPEFYTICRLAPQKRKIGSFTAHALFYLDLSYTFLCDSGSAIPIGSLIQTTANRIHVVSDS